MTSYFQTVSRDNSTYRTSTKGFLLTTLENDLECVAFAFFQFINKRLADRKYHLFLFVMAYWQEAYNLEGKTMFIKE